MAAYARLVKSTSPTSASEPYSAAQQRLLTTCAEADRQAAAVEEVQLRLREARRARAAFERESAQGLALADPRQLTEAKAAIHATYQEMTHHATDRAMMVARTAEYLRALDRLNRAARKVAGQAGTWSVRVRELDAQVSQCEMRAEAARVAAQAARQACSDARRALVQHDEELGYQAAAAPEDGVDGADYADDAITPIEALLQGDHDSFRALVGRLAEEVGLDARRLQLLLFELREALFEGARAEAILEFAPGNRFWDQFTLAEARAVAAALGVIGRGFDGRQGWHDGRVAEPRELATAIAMAGLEPRAQRVRPTQEELTALWQGTRVDAVAYVRERSPDLALETFEPLVGAQAQSLVELWDNWGRLRRPMLSPELVARA